MEFLLMLAQAEATSKPPSPWLLILGFVCLGYGIYYNRKQRAGKGNQQSAPKRKANMLGSKKADDASGSAVDDVAERVADEMDKSKKRKK